MSCWCRSAAHPTTMAAAKLDRQQNFSVQRGFTVKEPWQSPQLPPLHSQSDLSDCKRAAAGDELKRPTSAGPHPVTPQQQQLERLRTSPGRKHRHHARGHSHKSRGETEDSHTRLRSHDSATSTDDAFGEYSLGTLMSRQPFAAKIGGVHNGWK